MLYLWTILWLSAAVGVKAEEDVYTYNICNGLSNQILYHAGSIATAIRKRQAVVEVPNGFIVNGAQETNDNVLPSELNSIPFGQAFDEAHFITTIESQFQIRVKFSKNFDLQNLPECIGMASLKKARPDAVLKVLQAFKPSQTLQRVIDKVKESLPTDLAKGICLHHRDGQDWLDHCSRWGSIGDGIYRGNCLGVRGRSFLESLQDRGLEKGRWVYYCGDHEIPHDLEDMDGVQVITRDELLDEATLQKVRDMKSGMSNIRDLWALIDFFVCSELHHFIGNSVSTFSAIQIALREGDGAFWYNSQSIPLGDMWGAFQIPIVYTYTELSKSNGKYLLQASIASVLTHMPSNKIHILYNGESDVSFRSWLKVRGVIIHEHNPNWRDQIEKMRLNGNPERSHLFLHSGNYFGTWQRIDVPLFVNSEYCLLLDSDTVVLKPFDLADFGLNTTHSIAMSNELYIEDTNPSNAGVTLMNVPHLRYTHADFFDFIMKHVDTAEFDHPSPSDQGAYLVFYASTVRFLSPLFNFKPYWKMKTKSPFILHFHGAKPHDFLKYMLGETCDQAIRFICEDVQELPFLCASMQVFSKAVTKTGDPISYCKSSFQQNRSQELICNNVIEFLNADGGRCKDLPSVIRNQESMLTFLPEDTIEQNVSNSHRGRKPQERTNSFWLMFSGWSLAAFLVGYRRVNPKFVVLVAVVGGCAPVFFSATL
jgi:hypothetical protein